MMQKLFAALAAWLTVDRRQAIQAAAATLAPVAIGLGITTRAEYDQWLIILSSALQLLASLLSLVNLTGAWTIWKALRLAVYSASGILPALAIVGVITIDQANSVLGIISYGLTALAAVVAVVTSQSQQEIAAEFEALATAGEQAQYAVDSALDPESYGAVGEDFTVDADPEIDESEELSEDELAAVADGFDEEVQG